MKIYLSIVVFFPLASCLTTQQSPTKDKIDERQVSFNNDTNFIRTSINTIKAIKLLNFHFSNLPYDYVKSNFARADSNLQNVEEGKEIKEKLKTSALSKKGTVISDFYLHSFSNDSISLKSLISESKVEIVLIDFWASWCLPCRKNSDFLKTLNTKYSSKGLVILSVSIDDNIDNWIKAIKADNIEEWHHVIDNKDKITKNKLGILDIPVYILVDKDLRVIDRFNGRWKGQEDLVKIINECLLKSKL